jgi:uncharacterized membrane protein
MGWVKFKESLDVRRGVGAGLIVFGVILSVLSH